MGAILDEVIGPHVIAVLGPELDAGAVVQPETTALRLPGGYLRNPPPGAAAKSVDMGDQGGMALGAWRSMRTRSTMPSWRCSA